MPGPLTLMLVHAHPDDESIATGGVMARYAAEGVRVVCVTCTGGEHGEIVVPELDTPDSHARLGEIRAAELHRALAHLGPIEGRLLGYVDSGMMGAPQNEAAGSFWQADLDEASGRLLELVREFRPQVMVSYNDFGGYGHPDHIRAALITKAAFEHGGGEPNPPLKLYEMAGGNRRRDEVLARARERGVQPWWGPKPDESDSERRGREEFEARMAAAQGPITTTIDVRDFIPAKLAALGEHVTQLAREGFFLAMNEDDWRELLPEEEFTLRVARIGVRLPEDDLFAGLRN